MGENTVTALALPTVRYKNDTRLRSRLFTPESYAHPAKGHLGMWEDIIQRYTKPGDLVLDPMAGAGSSLLAGLMGRDVITVELEQHWHEMQLANWEKARQQPMLGCSLGKATILRGDARNLTGLLADAIITSPLYEYSTGDKKEGPNAGGNENKYGRWAKGTANEHGGYTRPSVIVTSPPYEGSVQGEPGIDWSKMEGGTRDMSREPANVTRIRSLSGYTSGLLNDSAVNIGNLCGERYWEAMRQVYVQCLAVLRPGGVMALVLKGFTRTEHRQTKPRNADGWEHRIATSELCTCGHDIDFHTRHACQMEGCACTGYVYARTETEDQGWFKGGYIDLPGQTAQLCASLGFVQFDHWRRELWSLSFWRILQRRRDPAAFDERLKYEEVLAFRKPEGDGAGCDAVLTSPPYEASEVAQSSDAEANRRYRNGQLNGDLVRGLGLKRGYTRQPERKP